MSPYDDPAASAGEIADYLHSKQPQPMKALSLLQPWATLIMLGYKQFETRSWVTKHRGPLAIAASAGKPAWAREACAPGTDLGQLLDNHGLTFDGLPRGAVLGVCRVNSMHKMDKTWDLVLGEVELACGDYTNGRVAWALSHVQAFATPIPCKGALSLWQVPAKVETQFPLSSVPLPKGCGKCHNDFPVQRCLSCVNEPHEAPIPALAAPAHG
jgi:hypothetical protein